VKSAQHTSDTQSYRKDRQRGKGYCVSILINYNLITCEQPKLSTDCEILWVKLEIKGNNPSYIASYYKTH
jgi:hypothetical protein